MRDHFSIAQARRDISSLLRRVADRGERIVLTSRGRPKAALVSLDDYQRLQKEAVSPHQQRWEAWIAEADDLVRKIEARRGKGISVDDLLRRDRLDLEARVHGESGP